MCSLSLTYMVDEVVVDVVVVVVTQHTLTIYTPELHTEHNILQFFQLLLLLFVDSGVCFCSMPCRAAACSCGLFARKALHIVPFSMQPKQASKRTSEQSTHIARSKQIAPSASLNDGCTTFITMNKRAKFVLTSPYTYDAKGSKY